MAMKHLYTKKAFGGLGLVDPITGGLIGAVGIQEAVTAVMDTMAADTEAEDIGAVPVLGVEAVEEDSVVVAAVDSVEVVVVDSVEVVVVDLVVGGVEEAVEAVVVVAEEAVK
jgi:hypothetical protein